jgi:hypothetical protein
MTKTQYSTESGKTFNLSQDQVKRINFCLAYVGAMLGCLCESTSSWPQDKGKEG